MQTAAFQSIQAAAVETLEQRRLLAAGAEVLDGMLVVSGTSNADVIVLSISATGAKVSVKINAGTHTFAAKAFTAIHVKARGGDDLVTVAKDSRDTLGKNLLVDLGAGDDEARLGRGADTILCGDGDDTVHAGPGDDVIGGHAGNDQLNGGSGDNHISGGDGNDGIGGSYKGNDTLFGGYGNDSIFGGGGDDLIHVDPGEFELVFAGAGNDVIYGGTDPLNSILHGDEGNDIFYAMVTGGTFSGDDGDDTIHGGTGNDELIGGAGNDLIYGGDGNDFLLGKEGDDTVDGGAGNDTLSEWHDTSTTDVDHLIGGAGADRFEWVFENDVVTTDAEDDPIGFVPVEALD